MPNSQAYQLYMDAKSKPELLKKLDQHMKMLDNNEAALLKKYEKSSSNTN